MREAAREAEQVPGRENVFRRLYLNQWTSQETRWLPLVAWDASAGIISPNLDGRTCYGGLYLTTTDLAAFVLVFPPETPDGSYQVLPFFWIPEENLHERVLRDGVPYDAWAREGLITTTEGNIVHYGLVRRAIEWLSNRYHIQEIAYNKLGPVQMTQELDEAGLSVFPFGYAYKDFSPPTKELLSLTLDRRLRHAGHPVLRWQADNLVVKQDTDGNVRPIQDKGKENITGLLALIMALDRATHGQETRSTYEDRDVLVL
jgi:phage terminase large subunit-like protein